MTGAVQKTSPRMSPSRLLPVYCSLWEAWSCPRNWNLVTQHRMSISPFITEVHLKLGIIGPLICKIDFEGLWWPLWWCQTKTGTCIQHTTGSKKRKRRADKIKGAKKQRWPNQWLSLLKVCFSPVPTGLSCVVKFTEGNATSPQLQKLSKVLNTSTL